MKKQFENDDTMEPISYSVATGKTEWAKTLDSREITIEEYLKRIDPGGIVWKDDGSLPLFDFSQEKFIEHIKTIKTFKKRNDYLSKLIIIRQFIHDKNGGSFPRLVNFRTLETFIELNTPQKSRLNSRTIEELGKIIEDETEYSASSLANIVGHRTPRTIVGWINEGKQGQGGARETLKAQWDAAGNSWIILGKDFKSFIKKTKKTK